MAENYFPSSPSVPPFIEGGQSSSDPENPTGTGFYPRPTPRFKWTPDHHHRFLEAIQVLGGLQYATPRAIVEIALILACGGLLLSSSLAETVQFPALNCRKHTAYLTDFGGKGDGKTLNTAAFQSAIANLSKYASDGGAQLIVPPGKWLTGPFNLTSHFTLYIHKDAVIIGTQDISEYAIIPALPSYGQGRDAPGPRMISLVFGTNLTDVVITGGNGTIDGQGEVWWEKFRKKELTYTRPYLIEIIDIVIQDLTILAPIDSENTDGIDPDSCSNVRIWDNYIVSGDDCIAVKSGWDEYGISVGMPTKHLSIKRLTCISPFSATIALGSEMSGGIQDVRAEDLKAINTESGVRIKTAPGRGGFVKDIYVRNAEYHTMKYVFWVSGEYNSHPDKGFDPTALPNITGINYSKINAKNVTIAGKLIGLEKDPFTGICISDATIEMRAADDDDKPKPAWNCTDISGVASSVTPKPCGQLVESQKPVVCEFPTDKLPIENVELTTCSAVIS
nr:probable polygalacturonase [Ipomoea trifida]